MIHGYARVSTDGQSVDTQADQLRAEGAEKVWRETATGANADRSQLRKMLDALQPGDTLLITRLDRLARSTRDLLNILEILRVKGASFKSLAEAWADTTTPHGRLLVTVLGGFAEFERELIKSRTAEGRARMKAEGRSAGAKPKLSPHQKREILTRLDQGEQVRPLAKSYGVSPATISRVRPS